ncbi:leucyl aminopeptidase family protein [Yunchengibacter salinarum]|uniref:leucyl aminopeptidase family protein n=1 Tax=Yunchengibacter salinarum TaxID=3133399 RepID=UPI0035B58E59
MPDLSETLIAHDETRAATAITPVRTDRLDDALADLPERKAAWARAAGFTGKAGSALTLPGEDGGVGRILVGVGDTDPAAGNPWWLAAALKSLPGGVYRLDDSIGHRAAASAALGWALGQYRFTRYKAAPDDDAPRVLMLPRGAEPDQIAHQVAAIALVRDLVNTPTEHMGPAQLQDVAEELAETFGAELGTTVGDDLLEENLPAIHVVGRAAAEGREPRLIDMRWSAPKADDGAPRVTLVGKGVCYDTGGLSLKPSSGMRNMKKDMGGAAHVLGLARLIMGLETPVHLRVLIPAVENAVAANSYRPGDVIATRKGLSVEVGNTDAEGRLVLCDALTLAGEDDRTPDLLIDFATLTGAARTALGPDLPATYSRSDALWQALADGADAHGDPLWRMPLWADYDGWLDSQIADLCNISEGGSGAGSITAALYLQRFVPETVPWAHLDIFAWSPKERPGRPVGGHAQGLLAVWEAIRTWRERAE